jgi:exopolysaccharide biosynthesis polyprenyl glycosylphosphotransferase
MWVLSKDVQGVGRGVGIRKSVQGWAWCGYIGDLIMDSIVSQDEGARVASFLREQQYDRTVRLRPIAPRPESTREGSGRALAAIQVGGFALTVLARLMIVERQGMLAASDVIFSIGVLGGFAILVNHWAHIPRQMSLKAMLRQLLHRATQAAAIILGSTIVTKQVTGASWAELDPTTTLWSMVSVIVAGLAVMAIADWWNRDTKARCVVVFGDGQSGVDLAEHVRSELPGTKVCLYPLALLKVRQADSECGPWYTDPKLVEMAPDVAVISSAGCDRAGLEKVIGHLAPLSLDVLVEAPQNSGWALGHVVDFAGRPCLRLFPKPLRADQRALKRVFDVVMSATLLLLISPVLSVVAVAVKLSSPGPIFFRQPRVGLGGTHFSVYKFRTMRSEACDLRADKPTVSGDPRVTQVGAFLRKTSFDELPQLLNVLLGDMSLVGPRPHAMNGVHFSKIVDHYHARHRVRPGITGLAQVKGWRGLVDSDPKIEQRVANDLRYISEWSLMRDIGIIWRTAFVLWHRNAF